MCVLSGVLQNWSPGMTADAANPELGVFHARMPVRDELPSVPACPAKPRTIYFSSVWQNSHVRTLCANQRGCTMQRARKQDGYIFKAKGKWYLRYFVSRVVDGKVKRV